MARVRSSIRQCASENLKEEGGARLTEDARRGRVLGVLERAAWKQDGALEVDHEVVEEAVLDAQVELRAVVAPRSTAGEVHEVGAASLGSAPFERRDRIDEPRRRPREERSTTNEQVVD